VRMSWKNIKSLRSQVQRSSFSVPSNIAEGIGRGIGRESTAQRSKIHFYRIALGSLKECVTQLEVMRKIKPEMEADIASILSLWMILDEHLSRSVGSMPISKDPLEGWKLIGVQDGKKVYTRACIHLGDCIRNCPYWIGLGQPCPTQERMTVDADGVMVIYECRGCWGDGDPEVILPENCPKEASDRVSRELSDMRVQVDRRIEEFLDGAE
jgi:four helix bundle protein